MSVSERAGEFGLAEEQAGLGWLRKTAVRGLEGITPGVERSCAQFWPCSALKMRKINQLAVGPQGPRVPIFEARMLSFYGGKRAN